MCFGLYPPKNHSFPKLVEMVSYSTLFGMVDVLIQEWKNGFEGAEELKLFLPMLTCSEWPRKLLGAPGGCRLSWSWPGSTDCHQDLRIRNLGGGGAGSSWWQVGVIVGLSFRTIVGGWGNTAYLWIIHKSRGLRVNLKIVTKTLTCWLLLCFFPDIHRRKNWDCAILFFSLSFTLV